jgi:hypothetical protein
MFVTWFLTVPSARLRRSAISLFGAPLAEASRRLDPVDLRHSQIHQHDVRPQLLDERDRFVAVRRLSHDFHLRPGRQQRAQPLAKERLIVGDEDRRHAGSSTETVKPSFGAMP